jgi:hypothetical protein
MNITADMVNFDWTNTTMTAESRKDTSGREIQKPVFKDDDKSYKATKFSVNLKTKKGKVYEVITEESGGFVKLGEGKRTDDSSWYGKNAWFTTCSDQEHPHFYLKASKAKIVPNKLIVTGPAHLVVADIPTPLYLPFGIFPLKKGQHNGIIFPTYGDSRSLGFFLKDGGYYFAFKDKYALALTGTIYTGGSWGLKTAFNYNNRYHFNGNFTFAYNRRRPDNPEKPGSVSANDFQVSWRHSQDIKARPLMSFTGAVNFQTSTYLTNSLVTDQSLLNTLLTSNIALSKSFRGLPISLSLSGSHNQNLKTRLINIDLPIFNFVVSRVTPFKSKVSSSKTKWYETIGVSYGFNAKSTVSTYDSTFLKKETLDRLKYGAQQKFTIDANISVFKYLKIVPSFQYTGNFYFKSIEKHWDPTVIYKPRGSELYDTINGRVITDTINKFRTTHEFNMGVNISTSPLIGLFKFNSHLIKALRHKFTPSIGFNYHPNFGKPVWNYWGTTQVDAKGNVAKYSKFENVQSLYGTPANGLSGTMNFAIGNNLEMKVYSKKDSVNHEKILKLIDNFNITTSYNFAADSLRLAPFNFSLNSAAIPHMNIVYSMRLDPYAVDQNNRDYNKWLWNDRKKLVRLTNAALSIQGRFQSKDAPALAKSQANNNNLNNVSPDQKAANEQEKALIASNPDYYYDFNVRWAITINYNFNLTRGKIGNPDTNIITQSISTNIDFNLTKTWKFNVNTGFDFTHLRPTLTTVSVIRELHCWELLFNWTAYPVQYQTYMMTLRVKSPILQELKLSKKRSYIDNAF